MGGCGPGGSPETVSLREEEGEGRAGSSGPDCGAAAGSNTESEVPREATGAVGPGSLGRTGEKGGEVQKRGAGKASGIVEGTSERGVKPGRYQRPEPGEREA